MYKIFAKKVDHGCSYHKKIKREREKEKEGRRKGREKKKERKEGNGNGMRDMLIGLW